MGERRQRAWRIVRWPGGVLAVALAAIQLVPYGWWHENPPVVQDAPWPNAEAAEIARTSCYSCHSNETDWPLYSYVAPMSWLVRSDVENGRDELNFSERGDDGNEARDAIDMILQGTMPPARYTRIHRDARLTADERDTLIAALREMRENPSGDNSGRGSGSGGDD